MHRNHCDTCRTYHDHCNDTALDEDHSYLRCLAKRSKAGEDKFLNKLEDTRDEARHYRNDAREAREEIARLRECVDELE